MGAEQTWTGDSHIRASNAEREQAVDLLRSYLDDGALSPEEFERRAELARAGRTIGDLKEALRGVPARLPIPTRTQQRRLLPSGTTGLISANATCLAVWAMTGHGYFWPEWVMLGTGLAFLGKLRRRFERSHEEDED